ncbi:TIGR00645 family protein [Hyphomicrobium sp. D-2]|uniref:TIGR00645 family protein n=1 Tax=Hyphomicrobium sp. D-2 TaxID=3041621 RepID=UPI002456ED94|nr:TIGR00645 family protein [Hyphomicrobium sp. D-2]MDH4983527.1 TIGR00645 family protein [Hyphomicrobium sp. D-2]
MTRPVPQQIERIIETVIFASRWILAPFYLGLSLALIVLLIKFIAELVHIAATAFTATESQVILGLLALVDLSLTASLIIIVIFSGYENFVSKIDHSEHRDWPEWMGTIDFTALKIKLLGSIVAISAIQLLKQFMSVNTVSDRDLFWLVTIHVVFVVSGLLMALSDRISGAHKSSDDGAKGKHATPVAAPAVTAGDPVGDGKQA